MIASPQINEWMNKKKRDEKNYVLKFVNLLIICSMLFYVICFMLFILFFVDVVVVVEKNSK